MKGFGMQVGDAEAVPQCAPVAPVVRLSGCMCQALNKTLAFWQSKKSTVAHVTPSRHSSLCKSLTPKSMVWQCQTCLDTNYDQPFLCPCLIGNTHTVWTAVGFVRPSPQLASQPLLRLGCRDAHLCCWLCMPTLNTFYFLQSTTA